MIKFLSVFGIILTTALSAKATDISSVVHRFDLRNCNKSRCVKVEALRAESGVYTPMLSLVQVEITVFQGRKKTRYTAPYGFIDLDHKRAVFRIDAKKELALNLTEIETKEFPL